MTTRTTFLELIKRHNRVEIPVIQRDYAQGRADQHIIRDDFIGSLHEALSQSSDDISLPLDLDFIYGSVVNGAFQPLDGQQRLTTLYLLHWYLAWVDGYTEDFHSRILTAERSRFSYEVRPSSREFINALAHFAPDESAAECNDLEKLITDQPWYFRSWQFDPTIRSALSMLNRIHEVFQRSSGLYAKLIDEVAPAIMFQLLDLEQFDLSDDLYIKMNARGKPLTPFETFKARFEKLLESRFNNISPDVCNGESLACFFAHRIDTLWSDFFWPFRDKKTATFDDAVMNLLRTVIMVTRAPDETNTATDIGELRNSSQTNSFTWFHDKDWLDLEMILAFITLLERWSASSDNFRCYLSSARYLNECTLFNEIISRPTGLTFQKLVQLAGYTQYLVDSTEEIDTTGFDSWMRVVSNLATNTIYHRPEDLQRSFVGLKVLARRMHDVLSYLASADSDVPGFFRSQIAEERIKAQLIGLGNGWPARIDQAERHGYFRGQIGFLLHCCGLKLNEAEIELERLDEAAANELVEPFEHYLACASHMFDAIIDDPKKSGRLWENALLAVGDFLPYVGRNRSLLTKAIDEPWGWKRLLRDASTGKSIQVLKDLWDRLESVASFAADLCKIIESVSEIDPWREAILTTPSVYDYGLYRMMRFSENGGVYLLRKSQMNGRHAELFTYCLYKNLEREIETYDLNLELSYYETTSTDEEPKFYFGKDFDGSKLNFNLSFGGSPERYKLHFDESKKPNEKLFTILEDEGFYEEDGWLTKDLERKDMKHQVLSLASALE